MDTEARRRIIYSLQLELEPLPGSPPGASAATVLPLNRDGMATGRNGRPRPPKPRTIDLRVGDDVMVDKQWRRVFGIQAYRENWIVPERAAEPGDGYVVQSKRVGQNNNKKMMTIGAHANDHGRRTDSFGTPREDGATESYAEPGPESVRQSFALTIFTAAPRRPAPARRPPASWR